MFDGIVSWHCCYYFCCCSCFQLCLTRPFSWDHSELVWVPKGALKKKFEDFGVKSLTYVPDALPVSQPAVSKHGSNMLLAVFLVCHSLMCSVYLSAFCLIIVFFHMVSIMVGAGPLLVSTGKNIRDCWRENFTGWWSFLSLGQYCLITEVIQVAYVQFVPTLDYSEHFVIQPVYIQLWVKPDSQWPPRKVFGDCWLILLQTGCSSCCLDDSVKALRTMRMILIQFMR